MSGLVRKKSYDPKCHDLAKAFLSDEPKIDNEENADELAQVIQTAIEDFLQYEAKPK